MHGTALVLVARMLDTGSISILCAFSLLFCTPWCDLSTHCCRLGQNEIAPWTTCAGRPADDQTIQRPLQSQSYACVADLTCRLRIVWKNRVYSKSRDKIRCFACFCWCGGSIDHIARLWGRANSETSFDLPVCFGTWHATRVIGLDVCVALVLCYAMLG